MELQYLSDSRGNHTAVVIPIEDWNNITQTYQDLKILEKPKQKLSEKYAGKLPPAIADELQNYVTQGRAEWNDRSI